MRIFASSNMMKKQGILHIALVITLLFFVSYSIAQESETPESSPNILVAYYSYSGNTQDIAIQINTLVGGELFRIEPAKEYPKDYQEILTVSKKEIDDGYKPALKDTVKDIAHYDIIFVGSPNWYSTIAPPVASFLSENNFAGKKVIPFITHGGGGKANCFTDINNMCPNATVSEGLAVYDKQLNSANQKIVTWLEKIQIRTK